VPQLSPFEAEMPINALCKCCRQSRTKCDMLALDGSVRECSRCKRLGLQCVPEQRRSSGKARLGSRNVEMQAGRSTQVQLERQGNVTWVESAAPSSTALSGMPTPPKSMLLSVPITLSTSNSDTALAVSKTFGDLVSEMTRRLVMGCAGTVSDRNVLLGALHIVLDVAQARDCCGLTAFAMQSAHQLGFPLSEVKPKEGLIACTSPLPVAIPPAVSDLFNSPCMVYVRAMSETKYWSIPNPHFAEYAVQRGADKVPDLYSHSSPAELIALMLDSDADRQRLLQVCSQALVSPLSPLDATSAVAQAQAEEHFSLRMRRSSRYVQTLSRLGVPLEEEAEAEEVAIPHHHFTRHVRVTDAASGKVVNFLAVAFSPFGSDGGGFVELDCSRLGQRKRKRLLEEAEGGLAQGGLFTDTEQLLAALQAGDLFGTAATFGQYAPRAGIDSATQAPRHPPPPRDRPERVSYMEMGGRSFAAERQMAEVVAAPPALSAGPSTDSGPSGESSVAEEELLAMLDSEVAAEALAGGDTPLISEMLAMIG